MAGKLCKLPVRAKLTGFVHIFLSQVLYFTLIHFNSKLICCSALVLREDRIVREMYQRRSVLPGRATAR